MLTGLFAQKSVAGFDGITVINGGWLDHHYIQLGYQVADSMAGLSYSFVMTTIAQEDASRAVWPACPSNGWESGVDMLYGKPNGMTLKSKSIGYVKIFKE